MSSTVPTDIGFITRSERKLAHLIVTMGDNRLVSERFLAIIDCIEHDADKGRPVDPVIYTVLQLAHSGKLEAEDLEKMVKGLEEEVRRLSGGNELRQREGRADPVATPVSNP